jgi:hypothetical protein
MNQHLDNTLDLLSSPYWRDYVPTLIDQRFTITRFLVPFDGPYKGKIVGYLDYRRPDGRTSCSTIVIDPCVLAQFTDTKQVVDYISFCVLAANDDLKEFVDRDDQ